MTYISTGCLKKKDRYKKDIDAYIIKEYGEWEENDFVWECKVKGDRVYKKAIGWIT